MGGRGYVRGLHRLLPGPARKEYAPGPSPRASAVSDRRSSALRSGSSMSIASKAEEKAAACLGSALPAMRPWGKARRSARLADGSARSTRRKKGSAEGPADHLPGPKAEGGPGIGVRLEGGNQRRMGRRDPAGIFPAFAAGPGQGSAGQRQAGDWKGPLREMWKAV